MKITAKENSETLHLYSWNVCFPVIYITPPFSLINFPTISNILVPAKYPLFCLNLPVFVPPYCAWSTFLCSQPLVTLKS